MHQTHACTPSCRFSTFLFYTFEKASSCLRTLKNNWYHKYSFLLPQYGNRQYFCLCLMFKTSTYLQKCQTNTNKILCSLMLGYWCAVCFLFEGGGLGGGAGVCHRKKRKTHHGEQHHLLPGSLVRGSVADFLFLPFRRKMPSPTSLVSPWLMTSAPETGRWTVTGSSGCWEKPSTASVLLALR